MGKVLTEGDVSITASAACGASGASAAPWTFTQPWTLTLMTMRSTRP